MSDAIKNLKTTKRYAMVKNGRVVCKTNRLEAVGTSRLIPADAHNEECYAEVWDLQTGEKI